MILAQKTSVLDREAAITQAVAVSLGVAKKGTNRRFIDKETNRRFIDVVPCAGACLVQ